jgi:hypothetical protein
VSPRSQAPASPRFAASDANDAFDPRYTVRQIEDEYAINAEHDSLVARERLYATFFGMGAGGLGGAAMLFVARTFAQSRGYAMDPAAALGGKLPFHIAGVTPDLAGFGAAVVLGAVVGAILGRATWRIGRIVPRVLFFSILIPVVWLFAQIFLIGRMRPDSVSAVPAGPLLLGSLAYALCMALLPAFRRSGFTEILPQKK